MLGRVTSNNEWYNQILGDKADSLAQCTEEINEYFIGLTAKFEPLPLTVPDVRDLFFYKSLLDAYDFPLNNSISFAIGNTQSDTNLNLRPKSFRTSLFKDSFFNRIVPLWNNLPVLIRQSPTF